MMKLVIVALILTDFIQSAKRLQETVSGINHVANKKQLIEGGYSCQKNRGEAQPENNVKACEHIEKQSPAFAALGLEVAFETLSFIENLESMKILRQIPENRQKVN